MWNPLSTAFNSVYEDKHGALKYFKNIGILGGEL